MYLRKIIWRIKQRTRCAQAVVRRDLSSSLKIAGLL